MKPIYIEMKAFGSYKEEKIDFDPAGNGIFLITGDTGAGKTTIFDAITYALYGKTSGGIRDGKMMRSQYAKKGMRTQVTFKFLYDGEEYTVTRSPKQPNYKLDKNTGEYKKLKNEILENVELIMPDGSAFFGSKDEKDKKIAEIIGLDFKQFTQVVMLAQGEFLKLLHASSQERKEIFARIFDTEIYDKIGKELEDRNRSAEISLFQNKKDISNELEMIKYAPGSDYEEEWEKRRTDGLFTDVEKENLLDMINKITEEANQKSKSVKKERENIQAKITEAEYEIRSAKAINNQFLQLGKYKDDKKALDDRQEYIKEIEISAKKGEKALLVEKDHRELEKKKRELEESKAKLASLEKWLVNSRNDLTTAKEKFTKAKAEHDKNAPMLHAEIDKIDKSEAQFNELFIQERKLDKREYYLKEQTDELKKISKKIKELNKSLEDITKTTETLQKDMPQIQVLKSKINTLESREVEVAEILGNIKKCRDAKNDVIDKEDLFKKYVAQVKKADEDYQRVYKDFIDSQAELLKAQLKDGEPCPVCGSIHHNVAHVHEHEKTLVNSDDLEISRKRLDQAKDREQEGKTAYEKAKTNAENIKSNLDSGCKRVFGSDFKDEKSVQDEYKSIKGKLEDYKNAVKQAKDTQLKIEKNHTVIESYKNELENNNQRAKESENKINSENIAITELKTSVKELKKTLPYESAEIAKAHLESGTKKLEELEANRNKYEAEYNKLKEDVDTKQGQHLAEKKNVETYSREIKEREKTYLSTLKSKGFVDTEDFKNALISEEKIAQYKSEANEYDKSKLRVDENIKRLEEETKDKEPVDTKENENRKAELEKEKSKLEKEGNELAIIISVNKSSYKKCAKLYDLREGLKEQQSVIATLYKTASGKDGAVKMDFQTYIQRRYFRRIINSANKRLRQMNNNQFELKCRDMDRLGHQGSVGLDLDICDLTENRDRDIKTLSGGESFVAALAMALGMGDVIQNGNGKVHIDTMFIDEGFGALSEETRNQAIDVLSRLSDGNNLVGIISHVEELKSRIDTKLVVTKTGDGSHAKWEID